MVPAPLRCTGRLRIRSPSGDSTLITSAPMSASRRVQCGPAMVVEKSSTRTPCSGRGSLRSWLHRPMRMRTTPPITRTLPIHSPADGRSLSTRCEAMKVKTSSIWPTARTRAAFSERHGERPAGRAQHAEDADPDRRPPVHPDLAELRPVAAREIERHQHDLDGVHAGQHGDAAHPEVALGHELGGFADGAGGDGEDRAREHAVKRALVREVGQHAAHIGERAAHAQDRHAAEADQDADPGAERCSGSWEMKVANSATHTVSVLE